MRSSKCKCFALSLSWISANLGGPSRLTTSVYLLLYIDWNSFISFNVKIGNDPSLYLRNWGKKWVLYYKNYNYLYYCQIYYGRQEQQKTAAKHLLTSILKQFYTKFSTVFVSYLNKGLSVKFIISCNYHFLFKVIEFLYLYSNILLFSLTMQTFFFN